MLSQALSPQCCRGLWYRLLSLLAAVQPWHYALKQISGRFGSSVLSYFLFLKTLLMFNIISFLILLVFVVALQAAYPPASASPQPFTSLELLTGAVSTVSTPVPAQHWTRSSKPGAQPCIPTTVMPWFLPYIPCHGNAPDPALAQPGPWDHHAVGAEGGAWCCPSPGLYVPAAGTDVLGWAWSHGHQQDHCGPHCALSHRATSLTHCSTMATTAMPPSTTPAPPAPIAVHALSQPLHSHTTCLWPTCSALGSASSSPASC